MQEFGTKSTVKGLDAYGIKEASNVYWNLTPPELIEKALAREEGALTETGALACDTGTFTGRSPKDRFIVKDAKTAEAVWWGDINLPYDPQDFQALKEAMISNLKGRELYVRDAYAGADKHYRLKLRVINTLAWQNLFCYNMFLRPKKYKLDSFEPNFTIICDPEFKADPATFNTRQENFAIINFTEKMILIGGTAYAGEMKKGIFSVLNFILPHEKNVLSMHCSANIGRKEHDTAIFFGLSGTGKTTLSADPNRGLIGDDEHGWTGKNVFNFEGGCYAKTVNLTRKSEPEIWDAIRFGAIVENMRFKKGTRTLDYENISVTENTRTAYPIDHIDNAVEPSVGGHPKNIFFLTCDAYGVLPPISRLTKGQAMYHFISGYTAKVAGTEAGITEPQAVFSACFGAPFMPLHPTKYAEMLGEKMLKHNVNVWMVNTGWTGGPYGIGNRMKLTYTRAMITAALNGTLNNVGFHKHSMFHVEQPHTCPGVPSSVLSPRETWQDDEGYYTTANKLVAKFTANFKKYADFASEEILAAGPVLKEKYLNRV